MKYNKEIFAYQLKLGDLIFSDGGYFLVLDLKGSYIRGRGLLVDIKLNDGWHRVECTNKLNIYRNV